MGKVYDALRRAEEQRARRIQEAVSGSASLPAVEAPAASRPAPPRRSAGAELAPHQREKRSLLGRLLGRRGRAATEDTGALNKRRIALLQPESQVAEQFRSLRARIDSIAAAHPEHPLRTIAVTSALQGDGKTMAAVSLAAVTSMNVGRRVLLVDCDLRKPNVAQSLGLRVDAGLAEVLNGAATAEEAIQKVDGTTLDVLPVRGLPSNPSELLASQQMRDLIAHVAGRYDRVILDLPPTLGLPDAKTVSELCDGLVFVVRAEKTPREDANAAIEVLDRRRILGLVLNDADENEGGRYGYGA